MAMSKTVFDSGRERFAVPLACPACGQIGAVIWEEASAANRNAGSQRKLILVSGGFRRGDELGQSGDPKIVCDYCDAALAD